MNIGKMAALIGIAAVSLIHAGDETLNIFGSIGAGFGIGGEWYESYVRETPIIGQKTEVKDLFYNCGSGMKFDLGCQYYMMDDVALQASFGYSAGFPFSYEQTETPMKTTTTFKRHVFGIKALVVPRFEVLDLIDLYTGVGIGFFWNSRNYEILTDVADSSMEVKGKITSKPALGFLGQLGADYPLNDNLTLFGEIGFEALRFNLNKNIVKESNNPAYTEGTRYYSKDDSNVDNPSPVKVPGSNWQIRVGVRYALK